MLGFAAFDSQGFTTFEPGLLVGFCELAFCSFYGQHFVNPSGMAFVVVIKSSGFQ